MSPQKCYVLNHLQHAGDVGPTPTAPSKEEFLQFGVDHGGDRETLARGLNTGREGTIKDITYKVPAIVPCTGHTVDAHSVLGLALVELFVVGYCAHVPRKLTNIADICQCCTEYQQEGLHMLDSCAAYAPVAYGSECEQWPMSQRSDTLAV